MKLNLEDIEVIKEYFNSKHASKFNAITLSREVGYLTEDSKDNHFDITNFKWLYNKTHIKDKHLQKILFEIGEKNKTPYAKVYENCLKNMPWSSYLIEPYYKLIKNKHYYPENENTFLEILEKCKFETSRAYWSIISLASVINDDTISAKVIDKSLDIRLNTPLTLLEVEKLKTYWDKRFNDKSEVPDNIKNRIGTLFETISAKNDTNLYEPSESYRISVKINNDRLSQELKTPVARIAEQVRIYLLNVKSALEDDDEMKKFLSFEKVSIDDSNQLLTEFDIVFIDNSKTNLNKKILKSLIEYGMTPGFDKQIQGYLDVKDYRPNRLDNIKVIMEKTILDYELNGTKITHTKRNLKI